MVESLPSERWLPVPLSGFEDAYLVSDHGRVYSKAREVRNRWGTSTPRPGRLLKQDRIGNPKRRYFSVVLTNRGKRQSIRVHHLVLLAFVGPQPEGKQGLHWDDDLSNNHVSNLRWGTPSENGHDTVRNGNHTKANQTACIHGHEFTAVNTYFRSNGTRACRTCARTRREQRKLGKVA